MTMRPKAPKPASSLNSLSLIVHCIFITNEAVVLVWCVLVVCVGGGGGGGCFLILLLPRAKLLLTELGIFLPLDSYSNRKHVWKTPI